MSEEEALLQRQFLLHRCQKLLLEVANQRYANSLLTKVELMLKACLDYKANRRVG